MPIYLHRYTIGRVKTTEKKTI